MFNAVMAVHCMRTTDIPSSHNDQQTKQNQLVFDASVFKHQTQIPNQFIWPDDEKPCPNAPELKVPLIDLNGFLSGDSVSASEASKLVGEACRQHGFFLVVNHGVDSKLISDAHSFMDKFFELPLVEKQRCQRKLGEHCGYASSFTSRFSTKLPWKETLSFRYSAEQDCSNIVQDYLLKTMGHEFDQLGYVLIYNYLLQVSILNLVFIF